MRETLLSFLDDCASRGDETAFAHQRGLRIIRWSYLHIRRTAFQFARELESRNIQKGDRIIFRGENSPEWIAAFFGSLIRGAIVVPLDKHSSPDFVRRVHRQVDAKLLLQNGELSIPDLRIPSIELDDLSEIIEHHSDAQSAPAKIDANDLVEIIFTSGTTAEPKGVCITHRNICANIDPLEHEIQKYLRWEKYFHPIRFLNLVPLSHVFGQFMGIFVPQLIGGEVFFQQSLNPSEIIGTVKRERISVIIAVPRQIESLREKIERDHQSSGQAEEFRRALEQAALHHPLRRWWNFRRIHRKFGWKFWAFVSGGATLDTETERFWQRLGYALVQGYGMTETASIISVNHPFKMSRGSIGKTMPGQEVRIDESGEIMVRGENVSVGYWNGGLKPLTNEEGWLRTGDIAERDEQGNLFFRGRKKDVIVTAAGLNIYPEDLESELNRQAGVRDSCVIQIESHQNHLGPEPLAVLILEDENIDPSKIIRQANSSLAEYQHIRRWHIWREQDFPRTATTGKVIKRTVAETVKSEIDGKPATPEKASALAEIVATISGAAVSLDPTAKLDTDLKLDSLGRVELMSAIEDRYQVEIDESVFTAATTIEDIEKIIRQGARAEPDRYTYPAWAQRFPATWIRPIVYYLIIFPITRMMSRARVRGLDRLNNLKGPVLLISNHISMVDHGLILAALPVRFRHKLAIAMEGERLRGWFHAPVGTGWFTRLRRRIQYALVVTLFNVFPLPQKSGFKRSFAYAGESVDRGYNVLVFPEGKTTTDGRMIPFMGGIGLLTSNLDIPVVPVKIEGLFELKEQRRYFARPGEISITFGDPVRFERDCDPALITRELEFRVINLT